ncbi:MAG: hypothetical protein E7015_03885 [Alphaproteobacteria bacterium]|nr:hypothetical protein [Alphaproteobacteria bacterium]
MKKFVSLTALCLLFCDNLKAEPAANELTERLREYSNQVRELSEVMNHSLGMQSDAEHKKEIEETNAHAQPIKYIPGLHLETTSAPNDESENPEMQSSSVSEKTMEDNSFNDAVNKFDGDIQRIESDIESMKNGETSFRTAEAQQSIKDMQSSIDYLKNQCEADSNKTEKLNELLVRLDKCEQGIQTILNEEGRATSKASSKRKKNAKASKNSKEKEPKIKKSLSKENEKTSDGSSKLSKKQKKKEQKSSKKADKKGKKSKK